MSGARLLERVRRSAGFSQQELAERAHTSRTTLSAYENGRKSPSLSTVERLLAESGYELDARPRITFHLVAGSRGQSYQVPDRLPDLPVEQALSTVSMPLTLNWSEPGRVFRLTDRGDRARLYEAVLRDGQPDDVLAYIDGALLVDIWPDLVLPREVRAAWAPLIDTVVDGDS